MTHHHPRQKAKNTFTFQRFTSARVCLGLMFAAMVACHLVSPSHSTGQDPKFDWSQATEWFPGALHTSVTKEYPNAVGLTCPNYLFFNPESTRKLVLQVVRIDLQHPALSFRTTNRAEGWGEPMPNFNEQDLSQFKIRTKRETTRQCVTRLREKGIPVALAINAAPWSPYQSGVPHPFADGMGFAVSDGTVVCPPDGKRPSLLQSQDGGWEIGTVGPGDELETVRLAVSGFAVCLRAGEPNVTDTVLHPRTGYGLSQDRRFLILVAIDGRQLASQGATVQEVGKWLFHFGAHDGLNMDGGGSTTLVRWDPKRNKPVIMNRPPQGERANGSHLIVVYDPKTETP
jgi:hypothetical protein